jgi:NAD(P) transhydrogenase subunit beta
MNVGSLASVAYIGATILFILSLGGLSNAETSRRGNLYGMIGMAIAVLATMLGPRVSAAAWAGSPRRWSSAAPSACISHAPCR